MKAAEPAEPWVRQKFGEFGNPCRTPTPLWGVGVGQGEKEGTSGFGNWRNLSRGLSRREEGDLE